MANGDNLWFDMGVRDNVTRTLTEIMNKAEDLQEKMASLTIGKDVIANAQAVEQALDKIAVARNRISEAKSVTKDKEQLRTLKEMDNQLAKMQKAFTNLGKAGNDITQAMMGTKDFAKYLEMFHNLPLAIDQVKRMTKEINSSASEEVRAQEQEENRVDKLKEKYYELYRIRKSLQEAVINAAPGVDTSGTTSMINSLTGRMGAIARAQNGGSGMPSSVVGADADEFLRRVKDRTKELNAATDEYNRKLATNRNLMDSLSKLRNDSLSQQRIASIRKQTVEYNALEQKIQRITSLMQRVRTEQTAMQMNPSGHGTQVYTKERVAAELDDIQRRYNEDLARGKQLEKEDAEAKNQQTAATRKKAAALQHLSSINNSLMASYNRIAEAGSRASRLSIEIGNQFASYTSIYAAERLLKSVITIGGQFEFQHKALQNILGDLSHANALFTQLQGLAVESPKTFMELTAYAKQLSAYQIPYEELYDTTKRLADISTGLGVDMSRIILAYGQVRSAAVLRGQELRQFTEAGIPLVQKLAEKFTELKGEAVSTGDVFQLISKRQVPFQMVKDILFEMTDEGGQFYDMQGQLADTLYGKWQKLQDSWQILLGNIAEGEGAFGRFAKFAIEQIVNLMSVVNSALPALSLFLIGKAGNKGWKSLENMRNKANGNTAIRNMELAKLEQANRLERERVWYGRKLTDQERELVKYKNKLVSSDYALLAAEGKISMKKAYQLMQEGEMSKRAFKKLLLMKEYTAEQRKQIMNGNTKLLQDKEGSFLKRAGNSMLGFFGGWTGVALTGAGVLWSLYESYTNKIKEGEELAKGAVDNIAPDLERINKLYTDFAKERPSTPKAMATAIKSMTDALQNAGMYTDELDKQVKGTDDLSAKYNILHSYMENISNEYIIMKENAEAYLAAANNVGANWISEGMASTLKEWSEANVKTRSSINLLAKKYGAVVKEAIQKVMQEKGTWQDAFKDLKFPDLVKTYIKSLKKDDELENDLEDELPEKAFEYLEKVKDNLFDLDSAEYKVNKRLEETVSIYETLLSEQLKLQGIDLKKAFDWSDEDAKKFNAALNGILEQYGLDEDTKKKYRDKILDILFPNKDVRVKIKAKLDTPTSSLEEWQQQIQKYFDKNGIKIYLSADDDIEKVQKKLQEARKEAQEKMDAMGAIMTRWKIKPDLSAILAFAKKFPWLASFAKQVFGDWEESKDTIEKLDKAEKELGINTHDDKSKKNKGSGRSEDSQLKKANETLDAYKSFLQEYEKYRQYLEKQEAIDLLENLFPRFKGKGEYIIDNYKKVLEELRDSISLGKNKEERSKFKTAVEKAIADFGFSNLKDKIQKETDAIKEYINKMRNQWSLYREVFKKTGDKDFASQAFSDLMIWDDVAYALREKMVEKGNQKGLLINSMKFSWRMTKEEAEDLFGKKNQDIVDLFLEIQSTLRKNGEELQKAGADAYKDALTAQQKVVQIRGEIEELTRDKARAENEYAKNPKDTDYPVMIKNYEYQLRAANKRLSEAEWEYFKEANDWGRVFGDLDKMSLRTINDMIEAMKAYQGTTSMSVKETKAWYEAMRKLMDKKTILDPIHAITDAATDYNEAARKNKIAKTMEDNPVPKRILKKLGIYGKGKDEILKETEDAMAEATAIIKKAAKELANAVKQLGSAFNELGNVLGGESGKFATGIGSIFDGLGKSIDAASNISNAKGITGLMSKVSAVATVVSAMVEMNKKLAELLPNEEKIYEHYAEKAREINKLREAVDDYRRSVAAANAEESEWFAGNSLSQLRAEGDKAKETLKAYYEELYEAQEQYKNKSSGLSKAILPIAAAASAVVAAFTLGTATPGILAAWTAALSVAGVAAGTAIGAAIAAGVGYAIGQIAQSAIDGITYKEGQVAAKDNLRIQTRHRSFWRSQKTANLVDWVRENLNAELFDDEGLINLEAAETVLEKYGDKLVGDTKETLERLVELRKEYDEFIQKIEDYVGEIGTSLAESMTNAIWDWLVNGEDALDKFKEYASDTWKEMAQDIIKTFMKVTVLDKYSDILRELFKAWSLGGMSDKDLIAQVSAISGLISSDFEASIPMAQQIADLLKDAFAEQGYDITGNDTTSSKIIKGDFNENETGLLLSYVNAIRADLSVQRMDVFGIRQLLEGNYSQMPIIAQAQLQELRMITANTGKGADYANMIYDLLHRLAPDGQAIRVN